MASEKWLSSSGTCCVKNRQSRVCCWTLRRRGLVILSKVGLPNNFVMVLKHWVCSKDQALANASSFIGAYHVSMDLKDWKPARVIFHSFSQHPRDRCVHSQFFWDRKNPISILDQSGWGHVSQFESKISTPFLTASTMISLDMQKERTSSLFQMNWFFRLTRGLKVANIGHT